MTNDDEAKKLCDAVDWFAAQMKKRLLECLAKGRAGWDDPGCNIDELVEMHCNALEAGGENEVDLANFCMFYAWRRECE